MKSTERFTERAAAYVAGRPSYPAAAIDAVFAGLPPAQTLDVADVGAGTGIGARLLARHGARVIAIEPNAAMRASAQAAPLVRWRTGTAENTGLGDGSVDLVTAFQAFHWFDFAAACVEMARILRPGGRAAVVYNLRDASDPFTAAYGALAQRFATAFDDADARDNSRGRKEFAEFAGWESVRTQRFANRHAMDLATLRARAASTSYLPKAGDAALQMNAELERLFERHARDGTVVAVMETLVTIGTAHGPSNS